MIITKEQLEALISNYSKDHSVDEICGFIDGIHKVMELITKINETK